MDCDSIKQAIPAYIKHSASGEETREVEEHLCVCSSCRAHAAAVMDEPPLAQEKPVPQASAPQEFGGLEYAVLGLGILVLVFFIFLLIKG